MFDIKQLDNAYDPTDQLLIALGVHPDQQDAKQKTLEALQNAPSAPAPIDSSVGGSSSPTSQPASSAVAPIARPNGPRPVMLPDQQRLANDQAEVDRLNSTGSGIHQIHNGFLRGLAHVGE